jgi:HlyD family secretion protein
MTLSRWLMLGAALALAGFFAWKNLKPPVVETVTVVRGKATDAVYATGTVEPYDRAEVKSKVAGTVTELLFKEGATVRKGDVLAKIESATQVADLARSQVDLDLANQQASAASPQLAALAAQERSIEAQLDVAKADHERVRKLYESGSTTRAEFDRLQGQVDNLTALLDANRAQQRSLRLELDAGRERQTAIVQGLTNKLGDTDIRAPMDGVLLVRRVALGDSVTTGQPLFKIGDPRELLLECYVDEADITRVKGAFGAANRGTTVDGSKAVIKLYAFGDQVFMGKVVEIAPDATRERKAFLVKVAFDKAPAQLRSGLTAEVNIIAGERDNTLVAPADAVTGGKAWVVREGKAEQVPVTTGISDLTTREILEGLAEGELLIVSDPAKLTTGQSVNARPRETPLATAAPPATKS